MRNLIVRFLLFASMILGSVVPTSAQETAVQTSAQDDNDAEKVEISSPTTTDGCSADVCAERQPSCSSGGWNGVTWCSIRPLWNEGPSVANDEIYPRVEVKLSANAIKNNRYVRFRVCEDLGFQPDLCGRWWAAKISNDSKAGKWFRFTPPLSTDDCGYTTALTHQGYYTQAQAKDGSKASYFTESANVPDQPVGGTQLDCN